MITINVPMRLELQFQTNIFAVIYKLPLHPSLTFKATGTTISLVLKLRRLYYETSLTNIYFFSTSELAQVHCNLGHAQHELIHSPLRQAHPIKTGSTVLSKLQKITKSCKGRQLYSKQPNRYRSTLLDQCIFSYNIAVSVTFIVSHSIFYVVCRQTHFSPAFPLPKQYSFETWQLFMTIWVTPYISVPYNLWVDLAKSFSSVQFKTFANSLGCDLVPVFIEAHWSLIAEHYHYLLKLISKKLIVGHLAALLALIMDYLNLAVSHIIRPEGFILSILAFGAQPRHPIGNYDQMPLAVTNWMDLMTTPRREYETILSQLRLRNAIISAPLNETELYIPLGDGVHVYRETQSWDGPYTSLYQDVTLSIVLDDNGRELLFHSTMNKLY